jgi:hypothetical protein
MRIRIAYAAWFPHKLRALRFKPQTRHSSSDIAAA